jgi:hypothetical protein
VSRIPKLAVIVAAEAVEQNEFGLGVQKSTGERIVKI